MCTSIQWQLEVSALQIVARMAIQALRAPEVAHGMRPQLGKERRKTVPCSGPGVSGDVWTDGASPLPPCTLLPSYHHGREVPPG